MLLVQPRRHLLRTRSGVTPSTGTNQSQTSHHRFCQFSVESSDDSLSTSIFPMVCADTSSTPSAFTTQYLGSLSLGTCSTFCTGYFLNQRFLRYKVLQQALHACQVPSDYSWEWHTQESVVYARTTHIGFRSAAQLYVGFTGQTTHRRELARRRKLILLSRDRIAYYEPALKIWHHQGNFYQGVCIVLHPALDTERRLAL